MGQLEKPLAKMEWMEEKMENLHDCSCTTQSVSLQMQRVCQQSDQSDHVVRYDFHGPMYSNQPDHLQPLDGILNVLEVEPFTFEAT